MIRDAFNNLIQKYSGDEKINRRLWDEIEKKYSSKKRYYHNLSHLEFMMQRLQTVNGQVGDYDTLLFSLFYHDIIYNTLRSDNESRSAELARERLQSIQFHADRAEACCRHILATKAHEEGSENDTNLFVDIDLSILGQKRDMYAEYSRQIRNEYSIYPDIMYKPGRAKLLANFLTRERIFKTPTFFHLYEAAARENIQWEIDNLKR